MRTQMILILVVLFGFGCASSSDTDEPSEPGTNEGGVNFHQHVFPILVNKCVSCHQDGGIAPASFTDPETVKAYASLIVEKTQKHEMPPWGAANTEECAPRAAFLDDWSLTDDELKTLKDWAEAESPMGDPAMAPDVTAPAPAALSRVDAEITPIKGFVAEGEKDQFICFVMDPKLDTTRYIHALNFVAGNPKVAHHALLFLDREREAETKMDENGMYPCFGSPGLAVSDLIGVWAPGVVPLQLPENAGIEVPAKSLFVMQMHYHPIAASGEAEDLTMVQIKWTDEEPDWLSFTSLIGNFGDEFSAGEGLLPNGDDKTFMVPAGAVQHHENMALTVPTYGRRALEGEENYLYSVGSHMHYLGQDMLITIERPETYVPSCDADKMATFRTCFEENCLEATEDELKPCVIDNCAPGFGSLSDDCQDCLAGAYAAVGLEMWKACGPLDFLGKAQPTNECLLHTPYYDFSWQRGYVFDLAIEDLPIVRPGDRLNMRCTYNNSLENTALSNALSQSGLSAPIEVVLGDETLDEMCIFAAQFLTKNTKKQ